MIDQLMAYQEASNQHQPEKAVAFFTPDGCIEMQGEIYQGYQALYDAHAYDAGSQTLIELKDFEVEGNQVKCTFINANAIDRLLGTGGIDGPAVFEFEGNLIKKFTILPPYPEGMERRRPLLMPFMQWVREHHSDKMEQARNYGFTFEGGKVMAELADLWQKAPSENQ